MDMIRYEFGAIQGAATDINFAATYSDRIVAMREGRIIADASRDEIMRPEVLREVYDTDVEVRQIDGRPVALYYA